MLCRHFAKPLGFVLGASFFVCIRHKVSFTDASPPSKCLQLASLHAVFFLSRFLSAKLLFSRFLWWCSQCRLITAPLLGASVYPYYTLAILLHLPAYVYYRTILSSALSFFLFCHKSWFLEPNFHQILAYVKKMLYLCTKLAQKPIRGVRETGYEYTRKLIN